MIIVMVGVHVGRGELHGIDKLTKRHNRGLVCAGAVYQVLQPTGLQAETDSEHDIRLSYSGNVARSGLK